MKNLLKVLLITLFSLSIIACSNDNDNNNNNPTATAGFKWRENSTTATENTAGSSEVRTQYKSIFAFQGATSSTGTLFEMNLTGVAPGTYNLGTNNSFYFNAATGNPTSGNVVITSNANGKASGTFEAHYASGSISAVYGTFTNIPVN